MDRDVGGYGDLPISEELLAADGREMVTFLYECRPKRLPHAPVVSLIPMHM